MQSRPSPQRIEQALDRAAGVRYGAAVVAVATATLLRVPLWPLIQERLPFLTYFLAVTFAAWYGGFGPGIAAVMLGMLAAAYFLIPPANSLAITDPASLSGMALFVIVGSLCALICEAQRRSERRAQASEARLRESREQLAITLRSIGDAVIATDTAGRVAFMNPVAQSLTGWTESEAVGRALAEVFPIYREGTREPADNPVDRVLREGVVVGLANHTILESRDGRQVPIDDSAAPIRREGGEISGVVLVFRDVSERRRTETARWVLAEAATILAESLDYEETVQRAARLAVPLLADWCTVHLLKGEDLSGGLRPVAAIHGDPAKIERVREVALRYPVDLQSDRPVARALRTGQPVWREHVPEADLEELAQDPEHLRLLRELRFTSYIVVPLVSGGQTLGTLSFVYGESGRRYSTEDVPMARELARHAATAIAQARLYGQVQDAQWRLAFLAEASSVVAASLDYKTTLKNVAALVVPHLADWCTIDVLEEDGSLRQLALAHPDPEKIAWARSLPRATPDMDSPHGAPHVLRTGEPELYPEIPDSLLVERARSPRELEILRQAGLCSAILVPLEAHGRVLGVLTLLTAESGRRYTRADLEYARELGRRAGIAIDNAKLYHAAQEADRRKDEFLAMLAHELRNPLAPMLQSLALIESGSPAVDAAHQHAILERQVRQLARLTDDLLDVSRITRGKIELRREPIDLRALVENVARDHAALLQTAGLRLQLDLPDGPPLLVLGDSARLAQVIGNLLQNSAKFTEPGGSVWLTVEAQGSGFGVQGSGRDTHTPTHPHTQTPLSEAAPSWVIIQVRDTGIGIAPELLPHVFDVFTQADRSLERSRGGLGLGLALVKELVQRHGGRVEAHSDGPGQGTELRVVLPLVEGSGEDGIQVLGYSGIQDASPPERLNTRIPECLNTASSRRVLVIEDNRDAAETLRDLLELWSYQVEVVHDGGAALEAARRFRPDAVLCDIGLPGMDGYAVAQGLKAEEAARPARLIAVSGYARDEDRERALAAGFDDHVAKPVDPPVLRKRLEQWLAAREE